MYEYKVIPAPLRTVKVKGLKTTAERFAHMMESAVNDEAGAGWEYVRSETLPCEERKGLTGTAKSFQTVLVFRRAVSAGILPEDAQPAQGFTPAYAPAFEPAAETAAEPISAPPDDPKSQERAEPRAEFLPGRQEPVFRPGAPLRTESPNRAEPLLRARLSDDTSQTPDDQR